MMEYLLKLLTKHKGNIGRCCKEMGIKRDNFIRICMKYKINLENYK